MIIKIKYQCNKKCITKKEINFYRNKVIIEIKEDKELHTYVEIQKKFKSIRRKNQNK